MYDLPYYREHDDQAIAAFIEQHPFALISGCDAQSRPVATQVPLFIDQLEGRTVLSGHIMRNTDHHRAFCQNPNVLAVFTGGHSYVSATWYSDPSVASTWNYMSVHARGMIRMLDGEGLVEVLQRTSLHFENHDDQSPTVFDNLPRSFKDKVMKAIVGFEVEVSRMDAVFKLSQDRDASSYRNIINQLNKGDAQARAIAAEMEQREQVLFPDAGKSATRGD
jgi:transcriptional regulator